MPPLVNVVNEMQSNEALLWLLSFNDYSSTTILRAVNNLEDVTSRGNVYTAFPFDIVLPPDDGQKPQSIKLAFPNVGRELMNLVRKYAPAKRPTVTLELVLESAPDSVEKTLDFFEVANVQYDALTITFELSSSSIFARRTMTAKYTQVEFPGLFYSIR